MSPPTWSFGVSTSYKRASELTFSSFHRKIQYTADFDPKDLQGNKCNCTWCQKRNLVNVEIKGAYSDFKLIKPKSKDDVADYAPETEATKSGMADGHRYFCANCGVHVWGEGWYEFGGEKHNFFSVNLATIDQPQDGIDLSETKIKYCDGLNNNWFAGLKDEPWSGGLP